jgi:hypothetical protein
VAAVKPGDIVPQGTVSFSVRSQDGSGSSQALCTGVVALVPGSRSSSTASCQVSYPAASSGKSFLVSAAYSGESRAGPSTSADVQYEIGRASTNLTVAPVPSTTLDFGQILSALATVRVVTPLATTEGAPALSGYVLFTVDGIPLGDTVALQPQQQAPSSPDGKSSAAVPSSATIASLTRGAHVLGAYYSGDESYGASNQTVTVTRRPTLKSGLMWWWCLFMKRTFNFAPSICYH